MILRNIGKMIKNLCNTSSNIQAQWFTIELLCSDIYKYKYKWSVVFNVDDDHSLMHATTVIGKKIRIQFWLIFLSAFYMWFTYLTCFLSPLSLLLLPSLSVSVLGHKQTFVSPSWYQATGGLFGEVRHEQPALWQAHEPQATTCFTGQ